MKLLLFSDLHADAAAASRLVELSRDVDLMVGAGDFGNRRREVSVCIEVLRQAPIPSVVVPGNNESCEELVRACKAWPSATVLHGEGQQVCGLPFFGLGGGVPITPFGEWSYDFSETDAARLLENCPNGAVLVSHSPPRGAVDIGASGRSLGSTAVRAVILRTRPRLVVCGHIHASGGQSGMVDTTTVVNAGPSGMIWTI